MRLLEVTLVLTNKKFSWCYDNKVICHEAVDCSLLPSWQGAPQFWEGVVFK